MARLPEPGGDSGQWGEVLNDYLKVAHNTDGTLKSGAVTTGTIQNNSVTVAKIATTGTPADGQALTYTGGALGWSTPSGSGSIPDATTTSKGIVQLTGDLGGTAAAPTVPGLAGKANTIHTHDAADITAGTLASAYLPTATESTKGAVQLATTGEAVTGTDTAKAVTAAGVTAAMNAAVASVTQPILFVDALADIPPGTPVDTLVIVRAA